MDKQFLELCKEVQLNILEAFAGFISFSSSAQMIGAEGAGEGTVGAILPTGKGGGSNHLCNLPSLFSSAVFTSGSASIELLATMPLV